MPTAGDRPAPQAQPPVVGFIVPRPGSAGATMCQVLVVAIGFWIAPDGRGMYFCAVVEPWKRLGSW
jgi:hypothetical protein